jgi:hypothetical protein
MNKNVGFLDAKLRVGLGVCGGILLLLSVADYLTIPILSNLGLAIVSTVLVVEGALRRCLLYRVLGIDRCPVDN